ncbi:MAG: 50S ribosomal protein L30 [Nitrospirae bacterium]|jgi:large subunit ribosomal protein L30|nr:50S ribosomal protein L30 [Nitrospirota bacterium]
MASPRSLTIVLKRSPIGTAQRYRQVLYGLGLRRMHQSVVRPDTPQVRGLIQKVVHLLDVKPS